MLFRVEVKEEDLTTYHQPSKLAWAQVLIGIPQSKLSEILNDVRAFKISPKDALAEKRRYRGEMVIIQRIFHHINHLKGWSEGHRNYLPQENLFNENTMMETFEKTLPQLFTSFDPEHVLSEWGTFGTQRDYCNRNATANFSLPSTLMNYLRVTCGEALRRPLIHTSSIDVGEAIRKGKVYTLSKFGLKWVLVQGDCEDVARYFSYISIINSTC